MKLNRTIFVFLSLLISISSFAKGDVDFDGSWDTGIKTSTTEYPIAAWVESNKEMLFVFNSNLGRIYMTITTPDGKKYYQEEMDINSDCSLVITLTDTIESGSILTISDDYGNMIFGGLYPDENP